jgi:transcription initiation factor TFIIF subunit beta
MEMSDKVKQSDGDPVLYLGKTSISSLESDQWMIRIPNKLASIWNDVPEGSILGELVFTKGGKIDGKIVKPSLSIECEESLVESTEIPLNYTMEAMTKKIPNLYPFSRNPNGTVTIHGTVSRTANLQASQDDPRYRKLSKSRLLETAVKNNRFVKPVESTELSIRKSLEKSKGFGSAVQAFGLRNKEEVSMDVQNDRKRKYQDTPTRSVVFELFTIQPFWTVKQLKEESGKPEKELRSVLNDIGEYHRSGEHKNMWQLKPEFQAES